MINFVLKTDKKHRNDKERQDEREVMGSWNSTNCSYGQLSQKELINKLRSLRQKLELN